VTSRDEFLLERLRAAGGSLTRTTDLRRAWSYSEGFQLRGDTLTWVEAKPLVVRERNGRVTFVRDGDVARQAILRRQQAERRGRGILDDFISLAEASDEKILNYAKTCGVLDLCWHGVPRQHESLADMNLKLPEPLAVWPRGMERRIATFRCLSVRREPLETWRFFARQALAILRLASELHDGRLGKPNDWSMVLRRTPVSSLKAQRACLDDALRDWLALGKLSPTIDDISHGLRLVGADLFGELAVQLFLAANRSDGQVFCIHCGKAYAPRKRVTKGGANVCPNKRCQGIAASIRSRRYRARKGRSTADGKRGPSEPRFRGVYGGKTNDPLWS
jgi:hypothetical protein